MQAVRKTSKVIAIACADIHASLNPPLARVGERNWFEAMARPLRELKALSDEHQAPILCAGDIFDRWNSSPEVINFMLEEMPPMMAIPGQHDLPLHELSSIMKSAFWTLVKAGKVIPITNATMHVDSGFAVRGFPYGGELSESDDCDSLSIAVIHKYIWMPGHSYPDAPTEGHVNVVGKTLAGYDVIISGDNHRGFCYRFGKRTLFNCGTLMRRKSDEIHYKPQAGLIYADGHVDTVYLDTSADVIERVDGPEALDTDESVDEFLADLLSLQNAALDFAEAVRRTLDAKRPSQAVRRIIMKAMEQDTK